MKLKWCLVFADTLHLSRIMLIACSVIALHPSDCTNFACVYFVMLTFRQITPIVYLMLHTIFYYRIILCIKVFIGETILRLSLC